MLGLYSASVPRAATILRARGQASINSIMHHEQPRAAKKSSPGPRVPSSPAGPGVGQLVPLREQGEGRCPLGEGLCHSHHARGPVSGLICKKKKRRGVASDLIWL